MTSLDTVLQCYASQCAQVRQLFPFIATTLANSAEEPIFILATGKKSINKSACGFSMIVLCEQGRENGWRTPWQGLWQWQQVSSLEPQYQHQHKHPHSWPPTPTSASSKSHGKAVVRGDVWQNGNVSFGVLLGYRFVYVLGIVWNERYPAETVPCTV